MIEAVTAEEAAVGATEVVSLANFCEGMSKVKWHTNLR